MSTASIQIEFLATNCGKLVSEMKLIRRFIVFDGLRGISWILLTLSESSYVVVYRLSRNFYDSKGFSKYLNYVK